MKNPTGRSFAAPGAAIIATACATLFVSYAGAALAQQSQASPAPADSRPVLTLTEIEKIVTAQGVQVSEIEVKDKVVEVEGRDQNHREVELLVDRRSGEILERKLED